MEDTKTQMNPHEDGATSTHVSKPVPKHFSRKREPLSQYVVNQNSVLDDTQSEQDSFQENLEREMQAGQNNKRDREGLASPSLLMGPTSDGILSSVLINKSMFQSYLTWFESNHVATAEKFKELVSGEEQAKERASQHDEKVQNEASEQDAKCMEIQPHEDVQMKDSHDVVMKEDDQPKQPEKEELEEDLDMQITDKDCQDQPKASFNIDQPANNPFSMNTITELDKTESNLEDPSLMTTQQADQSAVTEREIDMETDRKSDFSQA